MRFLEPFTEDQRAQIRASVARHGGEYELLRLESLDNPTAADAEAIIDLLGNDVAVDADGNPEPGADYVISVIEAVTEHWT
ncbi:hypothetical protein HUN08_11120 [Gordonia sp. X0973]|uniref:hypothetical protein n=1 Tax=Gordonia sp. X0973 TaxID=2742602 RepID=UPI000F520AAA|nr:hypothetical protein [Gordonia sp. X0973]QKT07677.1 hypothetical protein HUN08_11120 [Gordonia sp. X0973]